MRASAAAAFDIPWPDRCGRARQIPRFAFEKFPGAKPELTTQMKSVGEAMAFGRTFQESFQKVHPCHPRTSSGTVL